MRKLCILYFVLALFNIFSGCKQPESVASGSQVTKFCDGPVILKQEAKDEVFFNHCTSIKMQRSEGPVTPNFQIYNPRFQNLAGELRDIQALEENFGCPPQLRNLKVEVRVRYALAIDESGLVTDVLLLTEVLEKDWFEEHGKSSFLGLDFLDELVTNEYVYVAILLSPCLEE